MRSRSATSFPSRSRPRRFSPAWASDSKPFEAKESGGSLDGMHGAEDIAEKGSVFGARLQICEAALHAV